MQTINTSRVTSLSRYVTAEMPNESKFVNEGSYTVCLTSMYEVFDVFKKGHEQPPPPHPKFSVDVPLFADEPFKCILFGRSKQNYLHEYQQAKSRAN